MCIIVYKPAGKKMPDRETLANCWKINSDGAGYMYPSYQRGMLFVRKGLMDFGGLMDSLTAQGDLTNVPVILHFRIGTHGPNDKRLTHPFPISRNEEKLTASMLYTKRALAHNGIISLTSPINRGDNYSDTYYFVKDYASLIIRDDKYYKQRENIQLLERLADSKLAIMTSDGHVELIGSFMFEKDDGCWYSNSSYMGTSYYYGYSNRSRGASIYDELEYDWDDMDTGNSKSELVTVEEANDNQFIVNDLTGEVKDNEDGLYVYDIHGNVYRLNPSTLEYVFMDEFSVYDALWKVQTADPRSNKRVTVSLNYYFDGEAYVSEDEYVDVTEAIVKYDG